MIIDEREANFVVTVRAHESLGQEVIESIADAIGSTAESVAREQGSTTGVVVFVNRILDEVCPDCLNALDDPEQGCDSCI